MLAEKGTLRNRTHSSRPRLRGEERAPTPTGGGTGARRQTPATLHQGPPLGLRYEENFSFQEGAVGVFTFLLYDHLHSPSFLPPVQVVCIMVKVYKNGVRGSHTWALQHTL